MSIDLNSRTLLIAAYILLDRTVALVFGKYVEVKSGMFLEDLLL
jgi:hypothetical protein